MSRKAFQVTVEVDVQSVTCPGVWLCSNGKVSLQIYMFETCVQTCCYKPIFPIKCNEVFTFTKVFYPQHQLQELQKQLRKQWLYMELVQWQNCTKGTVLSTFQTTLDQLLYPSALGGGLIGLDLDLLMEPSRIFPGTVAPKIEISTKTTIDETICHGTEETEPVLNPKLLTSVVPQPRQKMKKVCHSVAYSREKHPKAPRAKPLFCYRRAEDDLILRKPRYTLEGNYCRKFKSLERLTDVSSEFKKPKFGLQKDCGCLVKMCGCGRKDPSCTVCSKYKTYFNKPKVRSQLFGARQLDNSNEAIAASDEGMKERCEEEQLCRCSRASLAEKLHSRLRSTLASTGHHCRAYHECSESGCAAPGEIYQSLQRFYGDLHKKISSNASCIRSNC